MEAGDNTSTIALRILEGDEKEPSSRGYNWANLSMGEINTGILQNDDWLRICGSAALVDLGRFFTFLIYTQSIGFLGRGISPSQGRYLHAEHYKQNKRTQKSMPRVWFEPKIPVFERAKTVHVLDRAATVIGNSLKSCSASNIVHWIWLLVLTAINYYSGKTINNLLRTSLEPDLPTAS
jgi:hypothetical protein